MINVNPYEAFYAYVGNGHIDKGELNQKAKAAEEFINTRMPVKYRQGFRANLWHTIVEKHKNI